MKKYGFIYILLLFIIAEIPVQNVLAMTTKTIRFQVTNGIFTDEALLGFYTAAIDEFDPYDSHKFSNDNPAYPELFFLASGSEVAINGVPTLIANKSLALGFRTGTAGSFTIRVSEFNNLDAGTIVILKDNLLSVEQNLTLNTSYTFTSAISTTSTRFTLFISKPLPKVVASDRAASDQFGAAVALSGEYAVVGNNPVDGSGSAYIFKL
ncbi:MAG: FG-GAP repeat protein, partial [Bacteroidia bacterium]|nr:FG-GAP repeat protein [Bacteroidia bacterium]